MKTIPGCSMWLDLQKAEWGRFKFSLGAWAKRLQDLYAD